MLVLLATATFQQNIKGSNVEISSNISTFSLTESNQSLYTQNSHFITFYKLFDNFTTGDKRVSIEVKNQDPTIANATIKLVSPNGIDSTEIYFIEEGNIYEFYVPDETWYVEIISKSDNAEVTFWYD